jgi:phosphate transport system substrate-binding protein
MPDSVRSLTLAFFLTFALAGCTPAAGAEGTPAVPSTAIENKGSDTMVNLALAWAEAYQAQHPGVRISVTGGGSGTGIAALINGTLDLANASRQIKDEERQEAEANGVTPVEFVVARDTIAVIVVAGQSIGHHRQISDIYGGSTAGPGWAAKTAPIDPPPRTTPAPSLPKGLRRGDGDDTTLFSPTTLLLPSSEGISTEVRQNPNAIGYDGLGYVTPDMKVVAVSTTAEGPFTIPSADTVNAGTYPIAATYTIYSNGEPEDVAACLGGSWSRGQLS